MTQSANLIDERLALANAVRRIRRGQLVALTFADESLLADNARLKEYFDADFDSPVEADMEKAVTAAAVRSVYASTAIPESQKLTVARAKAQSAFELMQYGKLYYRYATDQIMARDYDCRMRANNVVQRITRVRKMRNMIMRTGVKVAISAGASTLVHYATATAATTTVAGIATAAGVAASAVPVAAFVATFAALTLGTRLLPKKVREPLEQKFDALQDRACDIAVDAAHSLCRHMDKAAERMQPVLQKARDMARCTGAALRSAREKTVAALGKAKAKVMSWFGF